MSQQDVEQTVVAILDAMNAGDPDALIALTDPEIEFHSALASAVEGRIYRGRAGLSEYFEDINDAFGAVRWDQFEIVRHTGDNLVVMLHVAGEGRGSGVPLEKWFAQVWSLRDGKPWRNSVYPTLAEAFAAVGLSE